MVSTVLASVLESYLGQYLELRDTRISVGSEIRLSNVQLKEAALSDLGLPLKCVHGKVRRLVIKIPWFSLFTSKTTLEVDGVHLLLVPSAAVKYDERQEERVLQETKQKRLQQAEDARRLAEMGANSGEKGEEVKSGDSFTERLVANIIRNLEVHIGNVHLRYEDNHTKGKNKAFAAGLTLNAVHMTTTDEAKNDSTLKFFGKHVVLDSLAFYWRPQASLFSSQDLNSKLTSSAIDKLFDENIGTSERPVKRLKYMLGPICSEATLKWCPNPAIFSFSMAEIALNIVMEELNVSLTKHQYHDFIVLLEALEYMNRGARYRKYKARHKLEGLSSYQGRLRNLWKFAFDSVYEEEVMRNINNWSWQHMREHIDICKRYRKLYKDKLRTAKPSEELKRQLRRFEDALDEINIRIQRQLAEREVDQLAEQRRREQEERKKANQGGFWSWFSSSSSSKTADENDDKHGNRIEQDMRRLEAALSAEEKAKLFEVIDFQENASASSYPKSFVARILTFRLNQMILTIKDDDLPEEKASVLVLLLETVESSVQQRPAAGYIALQLEMTKLVVTGKQSKRLKQSPTLVQSQSSVSERLLKLKIEHNPPDNPDGDLDEDKGSFYDQRLVVASSPLEIVYNHETVLNLISLFQAEEVDLTTLQQSAVIKLKEYKESTVLGLQWAIEHHNLIDVDIHLNSSYLVLPLRGELVDDKCACIAVNLGNVHLKRKPMAQTAPTLTDLESKLANLASTLKTSLREQAYDKFMLSLDSVQALVSVEDEDWRQELKKEKSKASLLNPVSITLELSQCLVKNDPEMPLTKAEGELEAITFAVADYRLLKLAQIVDSLFDSELLESESSKPKRTDSESSMGSALSSMAGASTNMLNTTAPTAVSIVPERKQEIDEKAVSSQLTIFVVDFRVGKVNFKLFERSGDKDEKLFVFSLLNLDAHAVGRNYDLSGCFDVQSVVCDHLKFATPQNERPVRILNTLKSDEKGKNSFVSLEYKEVDRKSPQLLAKNGNVVRRLDVHMARVNLRVHREVVLDLINKILILIQNLSEKTKNVATATAVTEEHNSSEAANMSQQLSSSSEMGKKTSKVDSNSKVASKRRFSRQISLKTTAEVVRMTQKGKRRGSLTSGTDTIIDFLVDAKLEEVNIDFMTSRINFMNLAVKDLSVSLTQSQEHQLIRVRLIDFVIKDTSSPNPIYELVLQSGDDKVLDASIKLYNVTPEQKAKNAEVVDVSVRLRVGRVRVVFLMKTVQDLLAFLEPFSSAKDMVAEKASMALEEAAQSVLEAYANATRALLDIKLDAPFVTIPVSSESPVFLLADLGTMSLVNKFEIRDDGRIMDQMFIDLKDLKLNRALESESINDQVVNIVEPISFELHVVRNMSGSMVASDPPEIEISGTLYEVDVDLSRGDYNIIMAVLQTNFVETGAFALDEQQNSSDTNESSRPNTLQLPGQTDEGGLKKISSRASMGSQRNIRETLKVTERDPFTRAVEFKFRFKGFKAELFASKEDELCADRHEANCALAKLAVKYIGVDGSLLVNSRIEAKAYLENVVIDDNRHHEDNERRITRLMEAKGHSDKDSRMVEVHYRKEPDTEDQSADVTVYSFTLVGSIAYLLEIANFFVPDAQIVEDKSKALSRQVSNTATNRTSSPKTTIVTTTPQKMSVTLKVEEPDIILVENISDIDTYALMLNMQLHFKFWSVSDPTNPSSSPFSLMASLSDVRCHTCRYNPAQRESTMAQILLPCTLSLTAAMNESHGMRVNVNVSDLILNVSVHSIEIIQNSLMAFLESFSGENEASEKSRKKKEKKMDYSDLWKGKTVKESDFWFLRESNTEDEGLDVLRGLDEPNRLVCDEQAIINVNNVVIKVESGMGANTIPLVLIESNLNCDIKNWSQNMTAIGTVTLLMAYYNSKLALWEPVIEPITLEKSDGSLLTKRWSMNLTVQRNDSPLGLNYVTSPLESAEASEVSLANMDEDSVDGFVLTEHTPPLTSLSLQSTELMEVTVTKSFLNTLQVLQESFAHVYDPTKKKLRKEARATAPIVIHNCTGEKVVVFLECKTFVYYLMNEAPRKRKSIELEHNGKLSLCICTDRSASSSGWESSSSSDVLRPSMTSPLQEQSERAEATLRVRVGAERQSCELLISKADSRFFPFEFKGDEMGDNKGMLSEVRVEDGSKIITLGSIISIKNHFDVPIVILTRRESDKSKRDKDLETLKKLDPDESFVVPINKVYCAPYEFYFQLEGGGQNVGLECFKWRRLIDQSMHVETVHCPNRNSKPSTILNVVGTREDVFLERTTKLTHVRYLIDIRPRLVLKNCLPIDLKVGYDHNDRILESGIGDYDFVQVKPGQSINLRHVEPEVTTLVIQIESYISRNYNCRVRLAQEQQDLLVWRFESTSGDKNEENGLNKLIVNVQNVFSFGTRVLSVFAPFWIVNKSGKQLSYRSHNATNQVYKHAANLSELPLLFGFGENVGRSKKKAALKVEDSLWSDNFSLDTIEDAGKIACKRQTASGTGGKSAAPLSVGINISMSSSSLTKIITITPFYIFSNSADYSICVREMVSDKVITVSPDSCTPFWPSNESTKLIVYVEGTSEMSVPFAFDAEHTTLMKLNNKYGAINVSVKASNAETLITFAPYIKGLAPVLIINSTDKQTIELKEKGTDGKVVVDAGKQCLYTWASPAGQRTIVWSIKGFQEEFSNKLQSDGEGVIELDKDGHYMAWVSFLDGMQRTLLFTNNPSLCMSLAHSTGKNERIDTEIDFSITGIGLSVVNNSPEWKCEVLYTSITSSDIVWEIRRRGKSRFKSLTQAQCEALEADFLQYSREKSIGKKVSEQRVIENNNPNSSSNKELVVNYATSRMLKPHNAHLRRQHQKGLWIQLRMSQHQQQIHAKIYRIQIDNQMSLCLFPVIMAPVPAPRSVVADSIPKPFIEFSLLEYKSPERTDIRQFKYIHVLVQELHIKIDQGLLTAIIELMEEEEILDEDVEQMLEIDLEKLRRPLKDIATLHVTKGEKHFFDYLHLSPLKVHVSFSLTSYKSSALANKNTRRSNFIALFLQSLGVTVTDMHDVIFRLAYFERAHAFFLPMDLINEMSRHYTSQAIKQAYVIIFGLDVIGNPFGLVVGVGRSVEDLFYEPFQGAVEGPQEFAEGLAIGVRSVFSGVVGGAAGTMSRITGALGKGIASLTFDEDYQSKRREAIKKRGRQTVGESLARGSRGLVMGIVDGVTGVATKPIEGASKEGLSGFIRGVGKGVVGFVARPTGGIVDFASGTFDTVRRVADVAENVGRVRPARFIAEDGIVRNYNLKEAAGSRIVDEIDKGRLIELDDVYVMHEMIDTERGMNNKAAFVVTTKRVVFASYSQVLGNWTTDWEFELNAIVGPPPTGVNEDKGSAYVIIKPNDENKSKKRLGIFGSSEAGKKVFVRNKDVARKLARAIEQQRTQLQN